MSQERNFTEGKILSPLIRFMVPVFLAMFLQSMYQSYEIELVATMGMAAGDVDLTEEQIRTIIDFLTNLDFVPGQA